VRKYGRADQTHGVAPARSAPSLFSVGCPKVWKVATIEFTSAFHRAFMRSRARWPKNVKGTKANVEALFPTGGKELDLLLTSFECERYIKEKYCNSGIPMFFQEARMGLKVILEKVNCSN
jgi:hypothetical protein